MKKDKLTAELPGLSKPRGRPVTGKALSGSERVAKFRAERKRAGVCPCCGQALPVKSGQRLTYQAAGSRGPSTGQSGFP